MKRKVYPKSESCVYMYHLVLMTGALTVLSQALNGLVDESYILLIDVKSQ